MQQKPRPPGQRQVIDFPILHIGSVPKFDPKSWDFRVEGLAENNLRFNWGEFLKLPQVISTSDFHCVTGWTRLENQWEGVLFRDIARLARPRPAAGAVTIVCDGGYYTSLPLSDLIEGDVILAYRWNGQNLEPSHGGPLRLVVPQKYAYKSATPLPRLRSEEVAPGGQFRETTPINRGPSTNNKSGTDNLSFRT